MFMLQFQYYIILECFTNNEETVKALIQHLICAHKFPITSEISSDMHYIEAN